MYVFNEIMFFQWINIIHDHVVTERLIDYINRYGVNTRDRVGFKVCNYLHRMSKDQIKIVFSHNPDFRTRSGDVYYPGITNKKCTRTFKVLLKHDHDGRYLSEGCYNSRQSLSLWTYLNDLKQFYIDRYYKTNNTHGNVNRYYKIICKHIDLLSNHKNKKMTLFNMMLPWLDKSDKRARFQ